MKTVEMPKMGDTMEEGKILRWIKHEGDAVKKGESLAEVETDKVNIEIEAFASGVLRKILVSEGDSAPIGAGIALIGAPDEPLPGGVAGSANKKEAAAPSPAAQNSTSHSTPQVKDAPVAYGFAAQAPTGASSRWMLRPLSLSRRLRPRLFTRRQPRRLG
ncbi:MAG: hypothetical protein NVS3B14_12600 [Ktedonobacteraceae bacterium]